MNNIQQSIITDIIISLKQTYSDDSSGHDWLHLERVWTMAKRLAKGQPVDMFLVEMGALLHDVDDFKFKKTGEDSLKNTKELLNRFTINDSTKEQIYDIVTHVSYKADDKLSEEKTMEGKIVQDADRLDAIGAIGISRTFAYNGSVGHSIYDPEIPAKMNITSTEYLTSKSTAINHFYEKLLLLKNKLNTPQAKLIAERRHAFLEKFLEEFWAEVKGDA